MRVAYKSLSISQQTGTRLVDCGHLESFSETYPVRAQFSHSSSKLCPPMMLVLLLVVVLLEWKLAIPWSISAVVVAEVEHLIALLHRPNVVVVVVVVAVDVVVMMMRYLCHVVDVGLWWHRSSSFATVDRVVFVVVAVESGFVARVPAVVSLSLHLLLIPFPSHLGFRNECTVFFGRCSFI